METMAHKNGPISMKDRTHGLPHLVQVALPWVLLHHIHDGHPHASKLVHSPWSGAPWAGTWPAGSWGASPCKACPMAVSAGGWKAQGAGFWKAHSAGLALKLHTKHGFCEASFAT